MPDMQTIAKITANTGTLSLSQTFPSPFTVPAFPFHDWIPFMKPLLLGRSHCVALFPLPFQFSARRILLYRRKFGDFLPELEDFEPAIPLFIA